MNYQTKIKLQYAMLSKREKGLASYIDEHFNEIPNLSIEELAEKADISSTGITRFVKKVGYSGFVNFKLDLAKNAVDFKEDTIEGQELEDVSIQGIVQRVNHKKQKVLQESLQLLQMDQIEQATKLLADAQNVYILAAGASSIVAMDLQYKLLKIDKRVNFMMDSGMQKVIATFATPQDVAFVISYSGTTPSMKDAVTVMKNNKVPVIAVTSNTKNAVRAMADVNIEIPNTEAIDSRVRLSAMDSRDAELLVIDVLFLTMLFQYNAKKEQKKG